MTRAGSPSRFPSDTGWQLLGRLELPAATAASAISGWLVQTLAPLDLRAADLDKIDKVTRAAAQRAAQSEPGQPPAQLRLSVLIPLKHAFTGQNWGFFLIEKIETPQAGIAQPNHEIELFLYREGL